MSKAFNVRNVTKKKQKRHFAYLRSYFPEDFLTDPDIIYI